jgi:hypothetical protein
MWSKTSTNPVTDVCNRFDVEARLFADLANDGLLRRLARLESPAGQLPAKKITPNRQQNLAWRSLAKNHRLGDHQRA